MDALALLRLQIEWGADEALDEAPVNRLGHSGARTESLHPRHLGQGAGGSDRATTELLPPAASSPPWSAPRPMPARAGGVGGAQPPLLPSATPAERAVAAAGQAQSLERLRAALAAFDGCALRDTAANLVFAAGDPDAGLLLIGDPPGEAEDRSGTPFAGPDGALLDRMLASIGLARDKLLLSPLIPWRPPGGRPANPGEIAVCLPFLYRLIVLVAPSRLVLCGTLAARTLLGTTRRRTATAWADCAIPGHPVPIQALTMPTPAMIVRTAAARREAWAALRLLRHSLDAHVAKK